MAMSSTFFVRPHAKVRYGMSWFWVFFTRSNAQSLKGYVHRSFRGCFIKQNNYWSVLKMFYYKIIQTLSTGTIFYVCLKIVKFESYKPVKVF